MKSSRKITPIIAGLAAATALIPASAEASSVLSGYGGPGQGNQVILGAALLNAPGGGSGGGSGSGSSSTSPNLDASTTPTNEGSPQASGHAPSGAGHRTAGSKARTDVKDSNRSIGGVGSYTLAQRTEGTHSGLGLSSADVLYAVLALGALVLAGVLTRRLARTDPANRHG
jgi:hypothetical protein